MKDKAKIDKQEEEKRRNKTIYYWIKKNQLKNLIIFGEEFPKRKRGI